jgi:hypothetical protein
MNLLFWGLTLGTIGKICIAAAVLRVHHVMAKEHKIDKKVIRSFRGEIIITTVGIFLILVGYGMEIYFYHNSNLLSSAAHSYQSSI